MLTLAIASLSAPALSLAPKVAVTFLSEAG